MSCGIITINSKVSREYIAVVYQVIYLIVLR